MVKKREKKSGKGKQKIYGWAILLVGITVVFAGQMGLLATVTIDTTPPDLWGCYPQSTEADSPTPIWGNIKVYADVLDQSDIDLAVVEINGDDGYSRTLTLGFDGNVEYGSERNPIVLERWAEMWTVPAENDVSYTFLFTVKDVVGHVGNKTVYGYATTGADGYFEIAGQKVSQSSHIYLATRTVAFTFVATSGADTITNVRVDIEKGDYSDSFYLTKNTASTWTEVFTFPEDGTYTVKGFFYSGAQSYQRMNILTQFGEETPGLNSWMLFGLVLTFIGLVLLITGENV